jgi:5-aminolevulinate synthase
MLLTSRNASPGPSHIVPVLVGDAALAKAASDKLLAEHNIYVQSINYPTVAVGQERLRITVTPRHTLEQMDKLVRAVDRTFTELKINRLSDWRLAGGRASVGMPDNKPEPDPIWTDEQVGLKDGTAPTTLRTGESAVVDEMGVQAARGRFDTLLGPMTKAGHSRAARDALMSGALKMTTGGVPAMEQAHIPPPRPMAASA